MLLANCPLFIVNCGMARKKLIKKAEFETFPNGFTRTAEQTGKWKEVFGNDHPLTLELGCGKAEFSFEMAKKYPDRNFLGVDLKADRLWKPARDAMDAHISNIAFLCVNLLELDEHLAENEADEIWITFPDPFPKNRQAKHRMLNPTFLQKYQQVLKPDGLLHYKTDNLELFHYSLEVFVQFQSLHFHQLSFDLHADERISADTKILTTYERKFLEMGKRINYVSMQFH